MVTVELALEFEIALELREPVFANAELELAYEFELGPLEEPLIFELAIAALAVEFKPGLELDTALVVEAVKSDVEDAVPEARVVERIMLEFDGLLELRLAIDVSLMPCKM